ncbi:MAG: helix-turn-helix domain-containing protein [Hyphomicrobiaceae bacterium]
MLTPQQLRAARALVGWSREDLARESGISTLAIKSFETRGSDPRQTTIYKWRRALEKAGVVFIDKDRDGGPGVRLTE